MDDQKQQVIDSLNQANNILVTVKSDPTIDQLAACIALTLILDDQSKHATAVFSGEVPSVLEFLEPGKTLERNTDSLQDFIISLDKSKADKLRYKVEDSVVRIFITPYKTSITEKDLDFGQGDFNVDVVVALGVHNQDDLDQAITSHGRILHDATVISMNTEPGDSEDLGSVNWVDVEQSSLSEMVAGIADSLAKDSKDKDKHHKGDVIDNQIATALLTGIVAETERFGNAKTTPSTMETAARLLTAGANQELVASKLAEPARRVQHDQSEAEHQDEHDNNESDDNKPDDNKAPEGEASEHEGEAGPEGALMPSLLQTAEPGAVPKSIYEADEDQSTDIDHDDDGGAVAESDLNDPDKPAGDGSLDITHPDGVNNVNDPDNDSAQTIDHHDDDVTDADNVHDSQSKEGDHTDEPGEEPDLALAHAGTGFDMPQPADAGLIAPMAAPLEAPAPDTDTDSSAEAGSADQSAAIPALSVDAAIDNLAASLTPETEQTPEPAPAAPAIGPVNSQPQLADPADTTHAPSSEDQAAMDILKEHTIQPGKATIQPLHTHGVYIAPPAHDDQAAQTSVDVASAAVEMEKPSGSSYGLAPPMMGGTLTSNTTDDPASLGKPEPKEVQPAMLSHTQPDFSHLQKPLELNPASADTAAPASPPAPIAPPSGNGPLIAPLTPSPPSSAPGAEPTLSQLEQDAHDQQAAAMSMPAPALTPMLQPAPAGQQAPSEPAPAAQAPLPPTPPPLIPPLSPQNPA